MQPTLVERLRSERWLTTSAPQVGVPDILVNNAGINLRKPLHELTLQEWRGVIQTNLKGSFLCIRPFVPGMMEKRFGRIINMTSILSHVALPRPRAALREQGWLAGHLAKRAGSRIQAASFITGADILIEGGWTAQ